MRRYRALRSCRKPPSPYALQRSSAEPERLRLDLAIFPEKQPEFGIYQICTFLHGRSMPLLFIVSGFS